MEDLQEKIRESPEHGLAYARLSLLCLRQAAYENPHRLARAEVWSRRATALSPEVPEVWLARLQVLEQGGQGVPGGLVPRPHPGPPIEIAPDGLEQSTGRLHAAMLEAVNGLKHSLTHSPVPTAWNRQPLRMDLRRFLFLAGPAPETTREWLNILKVPERDPALPEPCLDLSAYYNAALHEDWHGPHWPGNNLATLPHGPQKFGEVTFDVRGVVQLAGKILDQNVPGFPESAVGITIGQQGGKLHFLQAAGWGRYTSAGTLVGWYLVHYADGELVEIPLRIGEDLDEWQVSTPQPVRLKRADVVWQGTNARRVPIQLFQFTWENPRGDVTMKSIDFVSTLTETAPFLIAITVEP